MISVILSLYVGRTRKLNIGVNILSGLYIQQRGGRLACEIVDIISLEKLIHHAAALYAVKLLIWAAVILAVQLIAGVIKRIIKNKHNQK